MTPPNPQSPTPENKAGGIGTCSKCGHTLPNVVFHEILCGSPGFVAAPPPTPSPTLQAAAEKLTKDVRSHFNKPRFCAADHDPLTPIILRHFAFVEQLVARNAKLESTVTELTDVRVRLNAEAEQLTRERGFIAVPEDGVSPSLWLKVGVHQIVEMRDQLSTARAERDAARKAIGPAAFGEKDGVYNICLGYHPESDQYEWLRVVPESLLTKARQEASKYRDAWATALELHTKSMQEASELRAPTPSPTLQAVAEEMRVACSHAFRDYAGENREADPNMPNVVMNAIKPILARHFAFVEPLVRERDALKAQFTPNGSLARENEALRAQVEQLEAIGRVHREAGISLAADLETARAERDAAVKDNGVLRLRLDALAAEGESYRQEASELRGEVDTVRELLSSMQCTVVSTIGGSVEGKPTHAGNYLQRLRALVSAEILAKGALAATHDLRAQLSAADEMAASLKTYRDAYTRMSDAERVALWAQAGERIAAYHSARNQGGRG